MPDQQQPGKIKMEMTKKLMVSIYYNLRDQVRGSAHIDPSALRLLRKLAQELFPYANRLFTDINDIEDLTYWIEGKPAVNPEGE